MLLFYNEKSKAKKVAVYTLTKGGKEKILFECDKKLAKKLTELWSKCQYFVDDNKEMRSFNVSSVCRADLVECLTKKQIAKIDDGTMEYLASKMGDAMQDCYWDALSIIVEDRIKPDLK